MIENQTHITKKISQSGLCSRRDAKSMVCNGKVLVDGEVITNPAIKINNSAKVSVDGKEISSNPQPKLWIFNKPVGIITTHKDPQNRQTVFDMLPKNMGRVISVGRLDVNSEGLLLLTNDGELSRYLEMPKSEISRRYAVRVFGHVTKEQLQTLMNGCTIGGIRYNKILAKIIDAEKNNSWLEMTLFEGKNREIRKILSHFCLKISKLIRVQYGPYSLEGIPKGKFKEVKITKEIYENYRRNT